MAAVHFDKKKAGVSFLDVSTGEFLVAEGSFEYIDKLIQSFAPSEVLFQRNKDKAFIEHFGDRFYTFKLEDWVFTDDFGNEKLCSHFETKNLKGYGIDGLDYGVIAAGAALHYLSDTQHNKIKHITSVSRIDEQKYVWLDRFTIRNLELVYSNNEGATTLVDILDHTVSPMGGRLMKRWVVLPLKDKSPIDDRLNVVQRFC